MRPGWLGDHVASFGLAVLSMTPGYITLLVGRRRAQRVPDQAERAPLHFCGQLPLVALHE
jgi:hypothetical protein